MGKITLLNQINEYRQKLLILQFQASDGISHNTTKGNMREEFIKKMLEELYTEIKLGKGLLSKDDWESSQIDLFKIQPYAHIETIGGQDFADIDKCQLIVEIKSNANSSHIKDFNIVAQEVKTRNNNITCGMFCYNVSLKMETLIQRFGLRYEKPPFDFYVQEELDKRSPQYPNIDFIFALEAKNEGNAYLIMRNIDGSYGLFKDNPVIRYFFKIFEGNS